MKFDMPRPKFAFAGGVAILVVASFCLAPAALGASDLPAQFVPDEKPVIPPKSSLLSDKDVDRFKQALRAADRKRWSEANKLVSKISSDIPKKIIVWRQYQNDDAPINFADAMAFVQANPDWPRLTRILRRAEELLPPNTPSRRLITWFAGQEPLTGEGKIRLGQAYLATNQEQFGIYWIRDGWINHDFPSKREKEILSAHGERLTAEDHSRRMERLLWYGKTSATKRLLSKLSPESKALAMAWLDLKARRNIRTALSRVPDHLKDHPGLVYEQVRRHRRADRHKEAKAKLRKAPSDQSLLGRPDQWWTERNLLVRQALKDKLYDDAYEVAAHHGLDRGPSFADGEWLAGWIALRFLNEPETAESHFNTLYDGVLTPISQARALYWSGRAAEAQGSTKRANRYYTEAAALPTTFYGQLGAEKAVIGGATLNLPARYSATENAYRNFNRKEVIQAVRLLHLLDQQPTLRVYVYYLADYFDTADDLASFARLMDELGYPNLSVRIAKRASRKHIFLMDPSYPVPELAAAIGGRSAAELALVLGLSRQESEFDPRAVSPAGARGLMQLMPATAKIVARQHKLPYDRNRLLDDPGYNLTLGGAHLGDLVKRYKGSYIMTIAAYNAGPGRVTKWVREYGDPRLPDVDPIDWVELIPFNETRNYVQRVLENTQIYRTRLAVSDDPLRLHADLGMKPPAGMSTDPAIPQPQNKPTPIEVNAAQSARNMVDTHGTASLQTPLSQPNPAKSSNDAAKPNNAVQPEPKPKAAIETAAFVPTPLRKPRQQVAAGTGPTTKPRAIADQDNEPAAQPNSRSISGCAVFIGDATGGGTCTDPPDGG